MYSLRRSLVDPQYVEVMKEGSVIEELKVSLAIEEFQSSFPTREEIFFWLAATEEKKAKTSAYRILGRRSHSKQSLSQKLKEKAFSLSVIEKIVGELEKMGYLSDAEYTAAVIRQKMRQGYGPAYIEKHLSFHQLDFSSVRSEINEEKQRELIRKTTFKCRGKTRNQKLQFFVRRGFDLRIVSQVLGSKECM